LAPNDFWQFAKIVCLKGTKISGYWRHPKNVMIDSESYTTAGVPKMFPTVGSIIGLSA
jgi:hypothetical protein